MNLETKDPKDMEVIIMNKPVLVIMAAGMGSRYGGLKQLDPVEMTDILSWIFPCMMQREPALRRSYS